MNREISVADIRSALDAIELHAFGASENEAVERDAHLFHILEDVRNIRRIVSDFGVACMPPDGDEPSISDLASALASKARPQ